MLTSGAPCLHVSDVWSAPCQELPTIRHPTAVHVPLRSCDACGELRKLSSRSEADELSRTRWLPPR